MATVSRERFFDTNITKTGLPYFLTGDTLKTRIVPYAHLTNMPGYLRSGHKSKFKHEILTTERDRNQSFSTMNTMYQYSTVSALALGLAPSP